MNRINKKNTLSIKPITTSKTKTEPVERNSYGFNNDKTEEEKKITFSTPKPEKKLYTISNSEDLIKSKYREESSNQNKRQHEISQVIINQSQLIKELGNSINKPIPFEFTKYNPSSTNKANSLPKIEIEINTVDFSKEINKFHKSRQQDFRNKLHLKIENDSNTETINRKWLNTVNSSSLNSKQLKDIMKHSDAQDLPIIRYDSIKNYPELKKTVDVIYDCKYSHYKSADKHNQHPNEKSIAIKDNITQLMITHSNDLSELIDANGNKLEKLIKPLNTMLENISTDINKHLNNEKLEEIKQLTQNRTTIAKIRSEQSASKEKEKEAFTQSRIKQLRNPDDKKRASLNPATKTSHTTRNKSFSQSRHRMDTSTLEQHHGNQYKTIAGSNVNSKSPSTTLASGIEQTTMFPKYNPPKTIYVDLNAAYDQYRTRAEDSPKKDFAEWKKQITENKEELKKITQDYPNENENDLMWYNIDEVDPYSALKTEKPSRDTERKLAYVRKKYNYRNLKYI